jgi:hypothetical protein
MSDREEAQRVTASLQQAALRLPLQKLPDDVGTSLIQMIWAAAKYTADFRCGRREDAVGHRKHFERHSSDLRDKLEGLVREPADTQNNLKWFAWHSAWFAANKSVAVMHRWLWAKKHTDQDYNKVRCCGALAQL